MTLMSRETMRDRLAGFDFEAHNAEVASMWAAFAARQPSRAPIVLGTNTRFYVRIAEANPQGWNFRRYSEDPDAMFDAQLRFQRWSRLNLLQDAELGLPDRWMIHVDFQNYYEAVWFGCPLVYYNGEVPDTRPAFAECPERVMESGLPDPFGRIMARGQEFYDFFLERAASESFEGRPIGVHAPWFGCGSDGPMTVACNLFTPQFVCMAMASEPDRLHALLDFITTATIERMKAWRVRAGAPIPQDGFALADDSVALISTAMYREHILPYHRRLYDAFGTQRDRGMHLCGNATRHFTCLKEELGISMFDTGFPVDFARLRRELGPTVCIQGGPHIELLRTASADEVYAETRRILESGVLEGGRFVLREGNNLAPGTPLENTEAMYRAGREYGRLGAQPA